MFEAAQITASIRSAPLPQRVEALAGRGHADLGQDGDLVVRPLGDVGAHDRRIDHAGLVDHIARLDARGLLDELFRGGDQRGRLAGGDRLGVLGVVSSST